MKRLIVFVIAAMLVSVTAHAGAQRGSGVKADPKLTEKLREHLTVAIANATLSEDQERMLRAAGETLRTASEAKQAGGSVDRDGVKQAFADIKTVLESDAFRPEDAKQVKADMEAVQKAMREQIKRELKGRRRPALASV
jgi:uncharacterized protein YaaN involved in tellurite resistance